MSFCGVFVLLLLLSLLLPTTTLLFLVDNSLPAAYALGPVSPWRTLTMAVLPVLFAAYGLRRNHLSISGAVAGIFLAQVLILANYCFLAQLLVFFLTGSKITKFRQDVKRRQDSHYKQGGARDWMQVLCTAGPAAAISAWYLLDCGSGEHWFDTALHYHCSMLTAAVIGSFACANGDTFSSEVGSVIGRAEPRLITTFSKVPRGTNGGVSVGGVAASAVGGALIGASHYISMRLCCQAPPTASPTLFCLLWLGVLGGVTGSTVDSVLGATLQYTGVISSGLIVSRPVRGSQYVCGRDILSNQTVNLLSGVITAFLLPLYVSYFY